MKKAKLVYGKGYILGGFFFGMKNFLKDKYIQKYFYGFFGYISNKHQEININI
jgi:hypothetical protein